MALLIIFSIIIIIIIIVIWRKYTKKSVEPATNNGEKLLSVGWGDPQISPDQAVKSSYEHEWNAKYDTFPYVAGAVVKMENENWLFVGGGRGQNDVFLRYNDLMLEEVEIDGISDSAATYSAVSFDLTNNGLDDLIVGRENGIFLHKNLGGGKFEKIKLASVKDKVPLSIAVSDINLDGYADIYASMFIHPSKFRPGESQTAQNLLLMGTGSEYKFNDESSQMFDIGSGGTFSSILVDLNGDKLPDFVLAGNKHLDVYVSGDSDESKIGEKTSLSMGRMRRSKYTKVNDHALSRKLGHWTAVNVSDMDNDGSMDIYATNNSKVLSGPEFDLVKTHALLTNNLKNLREIPEKYGTAATIFDANLDSVDDLIDTSRYINSFWDRLFKRTSYGLKDGSNDFDKVKRFGNSEFGDKLMVVDLNNDKILDVVWLNQNGPVRAFIRGNTEGNDWIQVQLPNNTKFINSTVTVTYKNFNQETSQIQRISKQKLSHNPVLEYGLGKGATDIQLEIELLDGSKKKINKVKKNGLVQINE